MGILDTGGKRLFGKVMGRYFLDGELIRRVITEDSGGSQTVSVTKHPVKVQTDTVTEAMRQAAGYTDDDVMLIVLTDGLSVSINTNDHVIDGRGDKWAVTMPDLDPCASHWTIRGQKA